MEWKKTFEVSKAFNILFLLFIIIAYSGSTSSFMTDGTIILLVLPLVLPLIIYFCYKAKIKFNINTIGLFKLTIPLFLIFLVLLYIRMPFLSLDKMTINVYFFTAFLAAIGLTIFLFLLGSLIGYSLSKELAVFAVSVVFYLLALIWTVISTALYCGESCLSLTNIFLIHLSISILYVIYFIYQQKKITRITNIAILFLMSLSGLITENLLGNPTNFLRVLVYVSESLGVLILGNLIGIKLSKFKDKENIDSKIEIKSLCIFIILQILFLIVLRFLSLKVLEPAGILLVPFFGGQYIYKKYSIKREEVAKRISLVLASISSVSHIFSPYMDITTDFIFSIPFWFFLYFSIYFPIAFLGTFLSDLIKKK